MAGVPSVLQGGITTKPAGKVPLYILAWPALFRSALSIKGQSKHPKEPCYCYE